MAHQFVFANATPERPALYFTILGESAIKMLRYQQQYTFFDPAKMNGTIRFINLSEVVLELRLEGESATCSIRFDPGEAPAERS
jgi:circadian clock protein KaiC